MWAVPQADICLPLWSRTSINRTMRVSWILIPGILLLPATRGEVIESFLQMKIGEVVAAHFASKESEKLLVLFDKGVLEVGSQDVMTVLDSLQGRIKLALEFFADALTEELRDFVSGQKQKPQLAGALEEVSNGKVTPKDKVAAVLNLADGVEAMKVHRLSLP